ncbi:MAG: PRC-barrel domain-containing protein [Candidatus Aenigmarchaeota archaeon]|nr:PRC-barrel domain-containing protein [Candidatus Aenigmarchaeota archaeon]
MTVPTAEEDKKFSRAIIGKNVVTKSGKLFGNVGDIIFEVKSGELIHLELSNPTKYIEKFELEKNKEGKILIPYHSVIAIGDFMVVSEDEI